MAVTFHTIQPNLLPGSATCGLCRELLKQASTTQPHEFKPRHNKRTPRTVVCELPSPGSSPVISQVQQIVGHGMNCRFHKSCHDRHLEKESTCYSCKSRVVIPLSEVIIKETLKVIGAGVRSYSRSLLGAGLTLTPEVLMRISLTTFSIMEANGLINPVFYQFGPSLIPVMLRTTIFAFLLFGVDPLSNKIHLPSLLSDTQKKIILYAGTIFTFPFICNYWRANAIMGNAFMAKNVVVDTIKKDGYLSMYTAASLVGVLGSMLTLRSLIF
ncbi:MAG TPA: hypothetical protein VLG44_07260 [Chlamydiales bacterium]|nr:hypothetical protein [Chlamydiales bacterium]